MKEILDEFFRDVTALGSGYIVGGLGLVFLIFGFQAEFFKLMIILVGTYFVAAIIRFFYFKERPNGKGYSGIVDKIHNSSFPSVHAGRVVGIAFLLLEMFSELSYVLLAVSVAILYSRVYLKKHYWIDIFGGIILGFVVYFVMGMII